MLQSLVTLTDKIHIEKHSRLHYPSPNSHFQSISQSKDFLMA